MRVTFFTAVINVQFASISGRGDEISDGLYITTDKDTILGLLVGDVRNAIGRLETDFLLNAPAVIYSRNDVADDFNWLEYLGCCLRKVKMFFHVMWLAKDNAADSELGFLTYVPGFVQRTHSNAVSVTYRMADGSLSVIAFSRKELKEIRAYYRAFIGEIEGPTPYGILRSELGRTMRAFYWIQAGRAAGGLGERIASFCTAMESLFATSSSELAHQLAERMAVFLSDQPEERLQVYRQVKTAYRLRSKVVHGDLLRQSMEDELIESSMGCDDLLRQAIQKAAANKEARKALDGSNESLDRYFMELLLTQRP
ncbi:MAG TPA: hypothetical protein VE056_00690 [Pyrinomonadaceae bacterium]|nr:hypothetical protein [Pyrinomonadaceae bacterium]